MTGMSRKKLLGLVAFASRQSLHALPHTNRLLWVVPCVGSKQQADVVCLRFMRTTKRQKDAHLGADAQGRHGGLAGQRTEALCAQSTYQDVLADPKVQASQDPAEVTPVQKVSARIIAAAKRSKYT